MDRIKATHQGELMLGEFKLNSYVLENGERVLSRIEFIRAIGRKGKAKGGRKYDEEFKTPVFLTAKNLKPFISSELTKNSTPIHFLDMSGNQMIGYKASLLPEVCYVFIDANDQKNALLANQMHIYERCKILVRSFAKVGIIALVDEATGYQYDREAQELQIILKSYISEELLIWSKRFPDIFYKEIFRLNGWDYTVNGIKRRPSVIGTWTNKLIYEKLPQGVLTELKNKTPKDSKGNRKHRFHQLLTLDIGQPDLQRQLTSVITIMKLSKDWDHFMHQFNELYGQTSLFDYEEAHITDEEEIEIIDVVELNDFDKNLKKALDYNPKEG